MRKWGSRQAFRFDVAIVYIEGGYFEDSTVPANVIVGEFEQLVMLTVLRLGDRAYALPMRTALGELAGRHISRGALYRTLDRLESKGFIEWEIEDNVPERGGHPRRRFAVTAAGVNTLRASRETLLRLWSGLESVLE